MTYRCVPPSGQNLDFLLGLGHRSDMEWEAYRSREIVWLKPKVNAKGEPYFYSKDGKTFPSETVRQQYEKLEDTPKP